MLENKIIVVNDSGEGIAREILFTFESDDYARQYVLYIDPEDESGEVFASAYTEEGELIEINDDKEWEMIEEVFEAFVIKTEEDEAQA